MKLAARLRPSPRGLLREMRQDRIAFDRSPSSRSVTADGHMRIAASAVSKANVCEYWGSEIPGADELGLDPRKSYRLYRHPGELRRAADSLNGKPLLATHRPQSADDHDYNVVVGALDNATWAPPFLRADITVWSGDGISLIDSGRQRQLSCSYRYTPIMKPGVAPDGTAYDGVMTKIQFNHCALVAVGRAGPDCMVGDSAQRKLRKRNKLMATDDDGEDNVRDKLLDFLASRLNGQEMLKCIAIIDGEDGDDDETAADPEVAAADRARVAAARQRRLAADDASRRARFPHANRLG